MATSKMKLRLGVADDPAALQPSLHDCLAAVLQQAEPIFLRVLNGLETGVTATGARRVPAFQHPDVRRAIEQLNADAHLVSATFMLELTRLVYEGGGKDQQHAEMLRFQDLQLFGDEQLDQSIEAARARQEVALAVDDALPALDALVSTMLGWRTIQPGLNPVRPDVFVRALQAAFAEHVQDPPVREVLVVPAAGLLGVSLRQLYKDLADWLRSSGVEPAGPLGGRVAKGSGAGGARITDAVTRTLLTLDKLRRLLAGDFDQPRKADFMHTVPASMALLQDLKKADELVKRLEQRPRVGPAAPAPPVDLLAEPAAPAMDPPRIGQQLGEEVVRLMFDNLAEDGRLLPALKQQLKRFEPAIHRLTEQDSRFFSDRNHPARQLLDRITQRSLAFRSDQDEGWSRFAASLEMTSRWLTSRVIDADTFGVMLDELEKEWSGIDAGARRRREEAARALLHAEQRNLLAQKLAAEFGQMLEGLDVADFIGDFLRGAWAQVVAEAQLSCADGSSDPYGYRQLVDDLVWSVQKSSAQRGRARRLVQMIPNLLQRMREGLDRIGYPPELTQHFFDHLITLQLAAMQEGRDAAAARVARDAADAAWAEQSRFSATGRGQDQIWLDDHEAQESGYVESDVDFAPPQVAPAGVALQAGQAAQEEAAPAGPRGLQAQAKPEQPPEPAVLDPAPAAEEPPAVEATAPAVAAPIAEELRIGTWVGIQIKGEWVRAQLTWCSPHATLFMFTSIGGAAHSMSRRTLDKLRAADHLRVVANRPLVDEALDQVAQAALKNSLK